MKLSILICTVPSRINSYLPVIINELNRQIEETGIKDIEIIYLGDNKKRSVGHKRNDLIRIAQGEYVCFIDDDDKVSPDFVKKIIPYLSCSADVICFKVECSLNGSLGKPVFYNKDFACDTNYTDRYERLPNHLMVVAKSIVLQVMFKDISFGEDNDYAIRLKPLLKNQILIDEVLYYYIFSQNVTEAQR
jgi:glycosyltransferase involved in cell wall biosynthesis